MPDRMIRRASYKRKSYTRKDGIKVKSSKVKSSMIKDVGKIGKGRRLFEIKDKGMLTDEGYSLKKSLKQRKNSLKKASKKNSTLTVLRHLNAIRTLQKNNYDNFKKLDKDVKFVQKEYSREK